MGISLITFCVLASKKQRPFLGRKGPPGPFPAENNFKIKQKKSLINIQFYVNADIVCNNLIKL